MKFIKIILMLIFFSCSSCSKIYDSSDAGYKMSDISISCWGDSKTEGDSRSSYPSLLSEMLGSKLVHNFGANGETSYEIIQRQGAYPLLCDSFIIPESNTDSVPIKINSRLRVPNAGCNPCFICDVKGEIIRNPESNRHFFKRYKSGQCVEVPRGTRVITDAMLNHRNDVMVIDIGYNGGYNNYEELCKQIKDMIDYNINKEYIVLGRVDNWDKFPILDSLYYQSFRNRFINLREFYIKEGLMLTNVVPTEEDSFYIQIGIAPSSLFYQDKVHENSMGNYVKAFCVFSKLKELGLVQNDKDN